MSRSITVLLLLVTHIGSDAAALQRTPAKGNRLSPQVRSACDLAYALAVRTPGASVRRRTGTFRDETLPQPVFGCGLTVSGSFARAERTGDAATRVRNGFTARGWQEMPAYSADGTDGTSFAARKADVACLLRGTWDGGAAGDPDLPAGDRYNVTVFCTSPAFAEDRQ